MKEEYDQGGLASARGHPFRRKISKKEPFRSAGEMDSADVLQLGTKFAARKRGLFL
jgi:hypothetical protein